MQEETFSTRYLPRAQRSGVRSNTRFVSGRTWGPRNGRHPTVIVIPTASSATRHDTTASEIFMKRITEAVPLSCSRNRQSSFNQCDTPGVPPARKWRDQPYLHNFESYFFRQHSLAKRKHVAIVMFARQPRSFEVPAQRAANAADFVRDDGLAVARTSKHDAALAFAAGHGFSRRPYEQRVIDRLGAECAEVMDCMAKSSQENFDFLFVLEAGMVGSNRNLHGRSGEGSTRSPRL